MNVAILGCGKQAAKHVAGLRAVPGTRVVVADIDEGRSLAFGEEHGVQTANIEEVFADKNVSVIDVCTPTQTHFEYIERAIRSGRDYFCEKPLCLELDQALALEDLTRRNKRIGAVGYVYRASAVFREARRIVRQDLRNGPGAIGRVVSAYFRIGGRGSHQLWKHRRETGGGAINEMLVHMIDLACWYFGEVASVRLFSNRLLRPRRVIHGTEEAVDAEDYVLVELEMENGISVLCQADMVTPAFTQFIEIQGDCGSLFASIQPDMPSYVFSQIDYLGYGPGKHPLVSGGENLFEIQMREFVEAVQSRRDCGLATVSDSCRLMRALDLLNKEIER